MVWIFLSIRTPPAPTPISGRPPREKKRALLATLVRRPKFAATALGEEVRAKAPKAECSYKTVVR